MQPLRVGNRQPSAPSQITKPALSDTQAIKSSLLDTGTMPALPKEVASAPGKQGYSRNEVMSMLRQGRYQMAKALGVRGKLLDSVQSSDVLAFRVSHRFDPLVKKLQAIKGLVNALQPAKNRIENGMNIKLNLLELVAVIHTPGVNSFVSLLAKPEVNKLLDYFKRPSFNRKLAQQFLSNFSSSIRAERDLGKVLRTLEKASKSAVA